MANRLKMAAVESVYALWAQGLSQRKIAGLLGIDRGTVRRHVLRWSGRNTAGAPPGSAGPGDSNAAGALAGCDRPTSPRTGRPPAPPAAA